MPLSIVIDGANRHDVVLAEETLNGLQIEKLLLMKGGEHGLCMEKVTTAGRWGSLPGRWDIANCFIFSYGIEVKLATLTQYFVDPCMKD